MLNSIVRMARAASLALLVAGYAGAQTVKPQASAPKSPNDTATRIEIYGFAQGDAIYDFLRNNPNWFDVNRPSRLPSFPGEFGDDHRTWLSARQSRFGTKASIPTGEGRPDIKIVFDWDLFGVGVDQGQTTIRPRHMYGQWGNLGGGQLESPFMDLDVFPNILEYWGPNGMLFFRNVQIFYNPIHKANGTDLRFAIERPGASADAGVYADRIELQNILPRFPAPDISGHYRYAGKWGYVQVGAIVRWIYWDDILPDTFDLAGHVFAGGGTVSSSYNVRKNDVIRALVVYGAGVENYFNDAPIDVGLKSNFGHPHRPVKGEALPDFGMSAYLDHRWDNQFTSAIGYSRVDVRNSDLQAPNAFKSGQYASTNLLYNPVPNVLMGGEFQYAHRQNKSNGFNANDYRLQFSVKYSFSQTFGGGQK